MRFFRGTPGIKRKKITDVDGRAAGFKSFAEFQGYVSELKAEVTTGAAA